MTLWDLFFIAVVILLIIEGVLKGALRLAFGLAGLLAGHLYTGWVAESLSRLIPWGVHAFRRGLVSIIGFLIILFVFILAGMLASRLAKAIGLSLLNRLLGAVLGFLLAVYLTGVAVYWADRLSPGLGQRMSRGPVVSSFSEWAIGLEEIVPRLPRTAPAKEKPATPPPAEKPGTPEAAPPAKRQPHVNLKPAGVPA